MAAKYTLYDWEQRFREALFGDLKVVKFILDEDTTTYACRNRDAIRPTTYGASLQRFIEASERRMSDRELAVFWKQVDMLQQRLLKVQAEMRGMTDGT